ncbi:glutamate [NMDA] receptor subunit 1 [Aedes aegypti]|uniref:Uncharacterized protein n=1 Tax=Aedes aegypti TaxID=7159 RepID=A0A6I8U704_AEDAE|nr:ionotropic receptor 75l precursor [Aedes aegypti]
MRSSIGLLLICGLSKAAINFDLFKDFLRWQHLKFVTVFHCLDQSDDVLNLYHKIGRSYSEKVHFEDISYFTEATWNHKHVMRYDYNNLGVSVDLDCPATEKLFEVVSNNEYFNASYYWLMFANGSLEESACLLGKQNLNIDAKVTLVVDQRVQHNVFDVYDVFSPAIKRGAALNTTLMGNWSHEGGFTITVNQTEYERRIDFAGISLKTAVLTLDQLHHATLMQLLTKQGTIRSYSLHRLGYRFLEFLLEKHNFSVQFIRINDWGFTSTDGYSSFGLVGQMGAKKVDFLINSLAYQPERVGVMDYTITIGVSKMLIVFRHPQKNEGRYFFLKPFRAELWIAIIGLNVVATLVVCMTYRSKSIKEYDDPRSNDDRRLAWLTVFGILFQQGTSSTVSFSSTRITLISTLVFSILISQFYSAYIVGYLLIVPPKTMNTVQHLIDSDFRVLVENLGYNIDFLNRTTDPVVLELYHRKILNGEDNFVNITQGLELVKRGGFAFQCDTAYAYPLMKESFTDKEVCDIQEIMYNRLRPLNLPLRKGSQFKQLFRITLRKVMETGNGAYQNKYFFSKKLICDKNYIKTVSVDLDHLLVLFGSLLGGMAGSFVIMLLEIGYVKVRKRKIQVLNGSRSEDSLKRD